MADNKPLTNIQKEILRLMFVHGGRAGFLGMTRRLRHWVHRDHGLMIRAYQDPQDFLSRRGLIQRINSNAPGYWYALTDDGRRRAEKLVGVV